MSSIYAILLPEVLDIICDSLDTEDVAICRSVSKQWRGSFASSIPSLTVVLPYKSAALVSQPLTGDIKAPEIPTCPIPTDMNAAPAWTLHMDDCRLYMHQALVSQGVDPWASLLYQLQQRERANIKSMRLCFHPSLVLQFSDGKELKVSWSISCLEI